MGGGGSLFLLFLFLAPLLHPRLRRLPVKQLGIRTQTTKRQRCVLAPPKFTIPTSDLKRNGLVVVVAAAVVVAGGIGIVGGIVVGVAAVVVVVCAIVVGG